MLAACKCFLKCAHCFGARFYNKRHHRRGFFWAERFKSVIVDNGDTLINCLAYIDLNPVRAEMVDRPEEYRWSSIGYHVQRNNEDGFLSLDFGPSASLQVDQTQIRSAVTSELHGVNLREFGHKRAVERLSHYRRFLYEKGGIARGPVFARASTRQADGSKIDEAIVELERGRDYEVSRIDRFRYRTRYFIDSGVIGSKEYVSRPARRA